MKRLIFIIAALFATAHAQTIQTIGAPTTTVVSRGNFRTDSIFYLPKRSKLPTDSGAVRYQISDSSVYYWTGSQWRRLGVHIDTAAMLLPYLRAADTTAMLSPYLKESDTVWLSNRINLKVNIADTSSMLDPYLRGSGTANYLPIFDASRSVINSKVYQSGTNLLFNTTTPSFTSSGITTIENNATSSAVYTYKIADTIRAYMGYGGSNTFDINNLKDGDIRFYTSATLRGRFQTDGTFRLNSLTGTGSRIVVADANGVLSATSSATGLVDTTVLSTRAWRQKGDDSLGAIIATKGSGTVTSVATGYGLSGGTITTTGTIIVDSAIVASRLRVGKVVDSLALVKQNVLTNPVTGTGTTNYVPKFTGASTIGNSTIFDDGEVKINTTSDFGDYKLQVSGNGYISGNLGIGGAATSVLHVNGGSTPQFGATALINADIETNNSVYNGTLSLQNTSTPAGDASIRFGVYGHAIIRSQNETSDFGGRLDFYTRPSDANTPTIKMTINTLGRVGIGTTSPQELFHVAGNQRITGDYFQGYGSASAYRMEIGTGRTGNGAAYIDLVGDETNSDFGLRLIRNSGGANTSSSLAHKGTGELNIYNYDAAPIIFVTSSSEIGRWNPGGELLLNNAGTDAGDYKLQVSGNAYVYNASAGSAVVAMMGGARAGALGLKIFNETIAQSTIIALGEESGTSSTPFFIRRYGSTNANASAVEIVNGQNAAMWLSTNSTERIRLHANGGLKFVGQSAAPTAEAGTVYYDTDDNKLKVYNGTTWVDLH